MATQLVCDSCGEVIDQKQPYWSVQATMVKLDDTGMLVVVNQQAHFDYHDGHLPRQQLAEIIPPTQDIGEDGEVPDEQWPNISALTIQNTLKWAGNVRERLQYALDQESASESPRRSLTDQLTDRLERLPPAPEPEPDPEPDPDAPHPDNELPEPEVPEEPEDPYPGVDISTMTIQQVLTWAGTDQDKIAWAIEQEEAGQNRRSLVDQLNNRLD